MATDMLSKKETIEVLKEFYQDCLDYWLTQPDSKELEDAQAMALKDLRGITHNPLKPTGEKLDSEAKEIFINEL